MIIDIDVAVMRQRQRGSDVENDAKCGRGGQVQVEYVGSS